MRLIYTTSMSSPSSQHGGIFTYILIGIVLFAALGYAVSRSHVKTEFVSDEKARLLGAEIITRGNQIKEAVSKIRLKGYPENQISFLATGQSVNYTNPNCTTNECLVFNTSGGGLGYDYILVNALSSPDLVTTNDNQWVFSASNRVANTGTNNDSQLIAYAANLSLNVCKNINVLLGIHDLNTAIPTQTAKGAGVFVGTYGAAGTITNALIDGKIAGCVRIASFSGSAIPTGTYTNPYVFYQVLIPR